MESIDELKKEIERLKTENSILSNRSEARANESINLHREVPFRDQQCSNLDSVHRNYSNPLTAQQTSRYSRQLILSEIGAEGQAKLLSSSVLVVGCGGLGSPVLEYLTTMGVGTIGIMDFDLVEESNLHRQVIHDESNSGMPKVYSALSRMKKLRKDVNVQVYQQAFDEDVLDIVRKYDIVVDATDNVRTRYLVNDACVLAGKPLVSASAVRTEGQLTVYNYRGGPCYRCLFPVPPPPETVTNCSDGGVLGVVPGILGSLQALEVVKVLLGGDFANGILSQKLLIFNARLGSMFRTVKLRARQPNCKICGTHPEILKLVGYENVSCESQNVSLPPKNRVSCKEYVNVMKEPHVLLDVRNETQYKICNLPNSWNVPLLDLGEEIENIRERVKELPLYVLCRRGIASRTATLQLLNNGFANVFNIDGGLTSWKNTVDATFPLY